MQNYFTFGHCTTSIGEGWNSLIKGQGELKKYLLSANLYTLIMLNNRHGRSRDMAAVKILKQLRRDEMRWSKFYQDHYDQFKMLSGTQIDGAEPVELEDGSKLLLILS